MSAFEPLRQALTAYFQQGFTKPATPPAVGTVPFLPVAFDNRPFKQPDSDPWARFAIRLATRAPLGVSRVEFRTPGFLVLQMFTSEESGTKPAYLAADKLAELLDNQSIPVPGAGAVLMMQTSHQTIGETKLGWWQVNATCNFQFDEIPGTP